MVLVKGKQNQRKASAAGWGAQNSEIPGDSDPSTSPTPDCVNLSTSALDSAGTSCGMIYNDISFMDFTDVEDLFTLSPTPKPTDALPSSHRSTTIGQSLDLTSKPPSVYLENAAQGPVPGATTTVGMQTSQSIDSEVQGIPRTSIESFPISNMIIRESEVANSTESTIQDSLHLPGSSWQSPLHIAAQKGHDRIVGVLLQRRADCNEKDSEGLTPLTHAIIGGWDDVVTCLVGHGARIGDVDNQRRTALHWAVLQRRERLLKILLKHCEGDSMLIDAYDNTGMTPLHTAVDIGFEIGVDVLLHYGANVSSRARKLSQN